MTFKIKNLEMSVFFSLKYLFGLGFIIRPKPAYYYKPQSFIIEIELLVIRFWVIKYKKIKQK